MKIFKIDTLIDRKLIVQMTRTSVFCMSFFILALNCMAVETYSQTARLSMKIDTPNLKDAIMEIKNQTEFDFLYSKDIEPLYQANAHVVVENGTIEEVLNQLFKNSRINYRIINKTIVLMPEKNGSENMNMVQQGITVTGTVTDGSVPLPGVNVVVKGTTTGVITDIDGKYSITVPGKETVLVFSFIGYITNEVIVGDQFIIDANLSENIQEIEEVVVVGYGTQKKINLTGSVASVNSKDLEERPQPNVQNMIQGKITGLQIVNNTGQPGRDNGAVLIRGKGSFGSSAAPLILIDGIVGSLSALAPEDIESISVLKDAASSAIYGARAANGVILVTTKKGKAGKTQVSYSFNYGLQQATKLSDQIWESSTYMELYNQYADRMGGKIKYSQDMIDRYKDPNRDMNLYPDYNWMDETFKTGSNMTHNLSVNGGNEKTTYNVSLGYLNQKGILIEHDYKRITGFVNLESQVHKRIKIGVTSNFYNGKVDEPYYTNQNLVLMVLQQRPMTKPYLPDGSGRYSYMNMPEGLGGDWLNRNPVWAMKETSRNIENWIANAQLYSMVDFIKRDKMQLVWTTKGGFRYADQFNRTHYPAHPEGFYYLKESDYKTGGANEHLYATDFFPEKRVENTDTREFYYLFYTTLGYSWNINTDHDISALLGYQEEGYTKRELYGKRENYPSDAMMEINGGSTVGQSLSGGMSQYALRSVFGRLNYAYQQKYLLEANFRYDGTSRIYKDQRWGIFPSFSGAWRLSEEKFIKDNLNWMDNLKLRASWGKLGNSEIGNYPYQDTYTITSYIFDGAVEQGVYQSALKDISLQWETTTVTDVGIDISLGNGLFSTTIDWYNKITDGILSTAAIPTSVGMDAPTINYGKLQNRGIELEVGHRNHFGEFRYGVSFMASFNKNKVLQLRAPSYDNYIYEEGKPYGEHYLYTWDGIFQSDADIASSPAHPNNPRPGDIKFKDLNNDNVIDSKDRQMVKGVYPSMLYSFTLNFEYKNFDLSLFFQGIEGRKIWTDFFGDTPFAQGAPPEKKWLNAWTPQNTNTDVPALYEYGYAPMTGLRSTYFLKDASYLRLKNLQFGYNLPKEWIGKIGIEFLRVYFSGENLLTFTDYPSFDPEREGDGWHCQYPQIKTYSVGLNLKF